MELDPREAPGLDPVWAALGPERHVILTTRYSEQVRWPHLAPIGFGCFEGGPYATDDLLPEGNRRRPYCDSKEEEDRQELLEWGFSVPLAPGVRGASAMSDLMAEWPHRDCLPSRGVLGLPATGPQFNTERSVFGPGGTKIRTAGCPAWWHKDRETIVLTLETAGFYRGRRRWTVREVPEVSATVNPILDAARWHLCQGRHAWTQYKVFIAGDRRIMAYGDLRTTACLDAYMPDYQRPKSQRRAAAYDRARWAAKIGMETRKQMKAAGLPCESRPRVTAETKRQLEAQRDRWDREALYDEGDETALSAVEAEQHEDEMNRRAVEAAEERKEYWKRR
jgi:hypothetical protein